MKSEKEIRDYAAAIIGIAFMLCGLIGMHYDNWIEWLILIPVSWIIPGFILDCIINGKGTRESGGNAMCCILILLNMAAILIHRDTLFIVGRILCSFGAMILIIRATKNSNEMST